MHAKVPLFVFLVALPAVFSVHISDEDLEFLANLQWNRIPKDLRVQIRKQSRTGDSSNWCCTNDQPVKTLQHSKIISEHVKESEVVKIGYGSCGTLGSGKCAVYDVAYHDVIKYHVDFFETHESHVCPDDSVKCCSGFILLSKNYCVRIENAVSYLDTLKDLQHAGLLG